MSYSRFYNKLVNSLEYLAENDVILYYPFFANCFPLAYFYSKALIKKKRKGKINEYIIEHDWNQKSLNGELPDKNLILLFDTQLREEYKQLGHKIKKINFTKYFPKFIFCDYNSRIINFFDDKGIIHDNLDFKKDFYLA